MMRPQSQATGEPHVPPPTDVAQAPAGAVRTFRPNTQIAVASRVVSPGSGTVHPGPRDVLTVNYTMWTEDGRTIDASSRRGQPGRWTIDQSMEGLRLGLPLMVAGETRRFWIPLEMTHGWTKSALVFDVELLRIDAVEAPTDAELLGPPADAMRTPSGVAYKVLRSSSLSDHPKPTSTVKIRYSAWAGRDLFDDSVGRGEPLAVAVDTVVPGLSEALQRMVMGERTRYWIPETLAYTPPGPPRSALVFDIELLEIQRASEGAPGTIDVRTNSPDAPYLLIRPDGTAVSLKGPQVVSGAPPGAYRIKPTLMRSYACGVLAMPRDMVLTPGSTLNLTITYRPTIR